MNARMMFVIAVCAACAGGGWGKAHAQVRFSPPPAEPSARERLIEPGTPFDKEAALQALEKGNSTIQGTACWRVPYAGSRAERDLILLLPVTPHLEELIHLRKRARPGETVVQSPDVLETSIATMSDSEGRFRFTDLKPGRYYLYAVVEFRKSQTHNVYRGTGQSGYGSVDYYAPETAMYAAGGEIETFVDVKRDGDVVRTTLTNRGLYASLFKCALT